MNRHSHRSLLPTGPRAQIAAAAALLVPFALAPVAGVLHLALVPHATCPEHGELVELDSRALHPPAAGHHANSGIPAAGVTANDPTRSGDFHGHHHCEVVPQRLNPTARTSVARAFTRAPSAAVRAPEPATVVLATIVPVLLLAPKASPPV